MTKAILLSLLAAIGSVHALDAAVVSGTIKSNGKGVAGVPVSDGYNIVTTDKKGRYKLDTDKRLGYVFYTLPSGYEPARGEAAHEPAIWAHLNTADKDAAETHNFEIVPVDNKKFDLVVVTDIHLANRADDLEQFRTGFMPRIKEYVAASDVPVYTVALGDLS